MLTPITSDKNLNAEESVHVVCYTLAGLRHRPFPLVWQPQKCHQLDDIPIKAIFSGTAAPLMWGLNFHPTTVKNYSYFLVLLGSETDWRVRNLGFETLDVLCSSQPLKVSCETVIKVHIYLEYKVSAFSNQNLRPFWFWQSYSALPTSNLYSWNLSSRGKTTKQQS